MEVFYFFWQTEAKNQQTIEFLLFDNNKNRKMNTSKWGPCSWNSMFHIAAGYDFNDKDKVIKDKEYTDYFKSLGGILPCKYCRTSYKEFYKKLDIKVYLASCKKYSLLRFVYDLKEMVNVKLRTQEEQALQIEYQKLGSKQDENTWKILRRKSQKICYTKPTPSFKSVVDDVMKNRAQCSGVMKHCRQPLNKRKSSKKLKN